MIPATLHREPAPNAAENAPAIAASAPTAAANWKRYLSFHMLPPWLVSLIFHLTAILLLAIVSFEIHRAAAPNMEVQGGDQFAGAGDFDLGSSDGGQHGDSPIAGDGIPLGGLDDQLAFLDKAQNTFAAPTIDPGSLDGIALPTNEAATGKGGKGLATGADGKSIGWGDGSKLGNGKTSLFGIGAEGKKFVYVFDRSESMNYQYFTEEPVNEFGNIPMRASKAELLASIYELNAKQQFFLIFYNHRPQLASIFNSLGHPMYATAKNKQKLREAISELNGEGGTNHYSALIMAMQLQGDVIYLMTDGEAKDDLLPQELDRIKEMNKAGKTRINVIQFAKEPRTGTTMQRLAEENYGKHVFIDITKMGKVARKPGEPTP